MKKNMKAYFSEFMLLKGKFDLGTKNQRDFSASVVRLFNENPDTIPNIYFSYENLVMST